MLADVGDNMLLRKDLSAKGKDWLKRWVICQNITS